MGKVGKNSKRRGRSKSFGMEEIWTVNIIVISAVACKHNQKLLGLSCRGQYSRRHLGFSNKREPPGALGPVHMVLWPISGTRPTGWETLLCMAPWKSPAVFNGLTPRKKCTGQISSCKCCYIVVNIRLPKISIHFFFSS